MTEASGAMELLRPRSPGETVRGLACLMAGPELLPGMVREEGVQSQVEAFAGYAATAGMDVRHQVIAAARGPGGAECRMLASCLWLASPGRTAVVFATNMAEYPEVSGAVKACLGAALEDARAAGVVVVQALVPPEDEVGRELFGGVGLGAVATLEYMERKRPILAPGVHWPAGVETATYSEGMHGAFREAILASYEGTLDCPKLTGMREIEDVIVGHQAVGAFDPGLWTVVLEAGRPIGCLLLAEVPARQALDLVYLGLAPGARGRGIGRALMQRALSTGHSRGGVNVLTVAVDEANTPARKLYQRFGYRVVSRRMAMVRSLA